MGKIKINAVVDIGTNILNPKSATVRRSSL